MAVCPHCKDSVPGCTGGDACPLVSDIATNSRFFDAEARPGAGCPNLNRLLSPTMLRAFSRPVCEAIVGIASAPLGGREADVSDADAYPDARSIVQAAFYGHCSISSALLELTSRMTEAGEDELTRYRAAVDVLKARGDAIYSGAAGVYSFVFAKVSNVRGKIASSVKLQLESPSGSSKSAELSTTLRRPATVNDFFEMVHNYVWAVIVLGLASAPIVFKFIANTVHDPMRDLNISWSCAFEYLNLYLHEMDEDTTGSTTFANVYGRGKQDQILSQAKINEEAFFRTRGGTPRPGRATDEDEQGSSWNGKHTATSSRCCVAYNLGRPHAGSLVDDSGTCRFAHVCMQWVSDKGPGGQCRGNHPKTKCTYDAAKKLDKPLK